MAVLTGFLDPDGSLIVAIPDIPPGVVVPAPVPHAVVYVSAPTPADMTTYIGYPLDAQQLAMAQVHLDRALALVGAYTRGQGFTADTLAAPLAQVALGLAGRSLANPTGDARVTAGNFTASPGLGEFTLGDRLIMDGFRRRVA